MTVDTTLAVPCTVDSLLFELRGESEPQIEEVFLGEAGDLPGSITLVSGGADEVTVTVTGLRQGEPLVIATDTVSFDDRLTTELRFVLDATCTSSAPCSAVGTGGYQGLPSPIERASCGLERYELASNPFSVRDACTMSATPMRVLIGAGTGQDEGEAAVAIPFPFSFYGQRVAQAWVGVNGYLGFGDTAPKAGRDDVGPSRALDAVGFPARGVLPFWDDLETGRSGVCVETTGTAPNRMMWITWKEACINGPTDCGATGSLQGRLTFTAALEETTNRVFIGYNEMMAPSPNTDRARGALATIGITNKAAKGCSASQCNAVGLCPDGETACGYTQLSSNSILSPLPTVEVRPR